jgi:hypothetical protein
MQSKDVFISQAVENFTAERPPGRISGAGAESDSRESIATVILGSRRFLL